MLQAVWWKTFLKSESKNLSYEKNPFCIYDSFSSLSLWYRDRRWRYTTCAVEGIFCLPVAKAMCFCLHVCKSMTTHTLCIVMNICMVKTTRLRVDYHISIKAIHQRTWLVVVVVMKAIVWRCEFCLVLVPEMVEPSRPAEWEWAYPTLRLNPTPPFIIMKRKRLI